MLTAFSESSMNRSKVPYFVVTGLFALAMVGSGLADLTHAEPVMQGMTHLGYPAYVATLLGGWKLLGVVAILTPGFPRLKEWAYAGFFFDLSGAVFSHASSGDGPGVFGTPALFAILGLVSWALRPADRRVGEVVPFARAA
jgi:uncharacterized membrane protein YphA (DoxX/SURF4 family)